MVFTFMQSHSHLTRPPVPPSTCLPAGPLPCSPLPQMMLTAKYVRVCLRNIKCSFVIYGMQDGISSVECLFPPLTTIPIGTWKSPLCTPHLATPCPRQQHDTFDSLPRFSISTLIENYIYILFIYTPLSLNQST